MWWGPPRSGFSGSVLISGPHSHHSLRGFFGPFRPRCQRTRHDTRYCRAGLETQRPRLETVQGQALTHATVGPDRRPRDPGWTEDQDGDRTWTGHDPRRCGVTQAGPKTQRQGHGGCGGDRTGTGRQRGGDRTGQPMTQATVGLTQAEDRTGTGRQRGGDRTGPFKQCCKLVPKAKKV